MSADATATTASGGTKASSTLREQFLEARRAEILEAARVVFADHGCDGASMQDVARAAGVSAGNIYRYFPSKEALIFSVCEDSEEINRINFAAANHENVSPLGVLFEIGDETFASFAEPLALQSTMLILESALVGARNSELGPVVERHAGQLRDSLVELVRSAQRAGELELTIDARAFGELLLSVVSGLRLLQLQTNDDVDADGVWTVLQRIVRAFGTTGGATDLDAVR